MTQRAVYIPVQLLLLPQGISGHIKGILEDRTEVLQGLWFGLEKAVLLCTLLPLCLQSQKKISGYLPLTVKCPRVDKETCQRGFFQRTCYKGCIQTVRSWLVHGSSIT